MLYTLTISIALNECLLFTIHIQSSSHILRNIFTSKLFDFCKVIDKVYNIQKV